MLTLRSDQKSFHPQVAAQPLILLPLINVLSSEPFPSSSFFTRHNVVVFKSCCSFKRGCLCLISSFLLSWARECTALCRVVPGRGLRCIDVARPRCTLVALIFRGPIASSWPRLRKVAGRRERVQRMKKKHRRPR